jgi:mono/diheme cytochrome c family protein
MNDQDRQPRDSHGLRGVGGPRRSARLARRLIPALFIAGACLAAPLLAQAGPSDDTLQTGAEVYSSACSACHQPGGAGLPGQYPPLRDNPNIDDADYVESVIRDGLEGPITVNGLDYDGIMPAQSTLGDTDIDAVVAYIQSGFAAPAAPVDGAVEADGSGGVPKWLPWALLAGVVVVLVAFGARTLGVIDRRTVPWFDATLKATAVVIGMIVLTTIIPARVIELDAVRDLSRSAQDVITMGCWALGLGGGLFALWWAHRESRI